MSPFQGVAIFVEVVNQGSFSGAAISLQVSKSHVSKQIGLLEDRLGVRLLNRTTRQMSLTNDGQAFYERCQRIMRELEEAEAAVTSHHEEPHGVLKISVPMTFGVRWLSPQISSFIAAHAALELDLDFSDRRVDIIEEGFDVVLRIGTLADSSFYARQVAPSQRFLVASPTYIAARGRPTRPEDLSTHDCLLYAYQTGGASWRLGQKRDHIVAVDGRVRANNGEALRDAACSGLGIALLPDFIVYKDLDEGRLVTCLESYNEPAMGIWALYPHARHLTAKVRAFIDFMVATFESPPWWME